MKNWWEDVKDYLCFGILDSWVDGVSLTKTGLTGGDTAGGEQLICGCMGEDLNLGFVEFEEPMGYPSEMSSKHMVDKTSGTTPRFEDRDLEVIKNG